MIITRTPLRISIGGGGTDLPSYYSRFGGFFISAAIDKYVFIALHRTFKPNYIVKYSELETVDRIENIRHPIVREAFRLHEVGPSIEMVSMADIPAGTGLGSSGSFNVGLSKAIHALKRKHISTLMLAEEACHIEIELLNEPIGKQDQYIAAFGGLTCFDIHKDGSVHVAPLQISQGTLNDLDDNLLMFFTGYSRSASDVLATQRTMTNNNDASMLENLHFIKETGMAIKAALERGETSKFGELMHRHWEYKKLRAGGVSNEKINRWYDVALSNGAMGGKLIGAGGGGFLLFYCRKAEQLRRAMASEGLQEVRFTFDFEGSRVLTND